VVAAGCGGLAASPAGSVVAWLVAALAFLVTMVTLFIQDAVADVVAAGGTVLVEPHEIPVGRLAVVADPFGNALILLDLSVGRYTTDPAGRVTAVGPGS